MHKATDNIVHSLQRHISNVGVRIECRYEKYSHIMNSIVW
jgi:hypothetical protein